MSHKRNKEKLDARRAQCDTQSVTDTTTDNESKIATLTKASKRVLEHVASYTFPGGAPTNLRAELVRLETAQPTIVTAFTEARSARIAAIKAALANVDPAATQTDSRDEARLARMVERALKNAGGGDKFGR